MLIGRAETIITNCWGWKPMFKVWYSLNSHLNIDSVQAKGSERQALLSYYAYYKSDVFLHLLMQRREREKRHERRSWITSNSIVEPVHFWISKFIPFWELYYVRKVEGCSIYYLPQLHLASWEHIDNKIDVWQQIHEKELITGWDTRESITHNRRHDKL